MPNITKVYLLNVPLESDYKNTLYFASPTEQNNYMTSRIVKSYTDFNYQRKDFKIKVPDHIDNLYKSCNYVMYQNSAYSNKWFFAFITDMQYINDDVTEIAIETDVMQTWMFDYEIKPSFVEREHCDNDKIGLHTIPENLETGIEHAVNNYKYYGFDGCYAIVASTWNPYENARMSGAIYRDGLINGISWYAFDVSYNPDSLDMDGEELKLLKSEVKALNDFIFETTKAGHAEWIASVFAIPKKCLPELSIDPENPATRKVPSSFFDSENSDEIFLEKPKNLFSYTPKNNKLFCFPYCYILASNISGSTNIYKYEEFYYRDDEGDMNNQNDSVYFNFDFVPCEGASIKMYPVQYKGTKGGLFNEDFYDEGFMCGKFPAFSYTTDSYINWLTQNSVNMAASVGTSALGAIANIATGNIVGGVSGFLGDVTQTLTQIHNANFIPNVAKGNVNGGDVLFSSRKLGFHFYQMSIKPEYAKAIDEYFTIFGYKCNRVKIPNENHRRRFWFTKTIDINIDGAIPNKDMQSIKDCYNRGITFWKSASDINNYSDPNEITVNPY